MHAKTLVSTAGAVQAAAGWTWLFFTSSANLTRRAIGARGPFGAVLGLYPAWCAFATLLSTRIWQLNRGG